MFQIYRKEEGEMEKKDRMKYYCVPIGKSHLKIYEGGAGGFIDFSTPEFQEFAKEKRIVAGTRILVQRTNYNDIRHVYIFLSQ